MFFPALVSTRVLLPDLVRVLFQYPAVLFWRFVCINQKRIIVSDFLTESCCLIFVCEHLSPVIHRQVGHGNHQIIVFHISRYLDAFDLRASLVPDPIPGQITQSDQGYEGEGRQGSPSCEVVVQGDQAGRDPEIEDTAGLHGWGFHVVLIGIDEIEIWLS